MIKIKKGMALLLAALLCVPNVSALASDTAVPSGDEVSYNTGSFEYKLVDEDTLNQMYENLDEDDDEAVMEAMHYQAYNENGDYTIQLEQNAFFPYEVQFTCNGEVTDHWFMTADDSIEIGGHTFTVASETDGSVVTQMSFQAGDKKAVVYPEKKTFTDDADSLISTYSLLPLEEKQLTVDLTALTPLELTGVSVTDVFAGDNALGDGAYVMYRRDNNNSKNYATASASTPMNLSANTSSSYSYWEMIVGEKDQLADSNIRYDVSVHTASTQNWLQSVVYTEKDGERTAVTKVDSRYYDYDSDSREFRIEALGDYADQFYVSLAINTEVFSPSEDLAIKVYEGQCNTEKQLQSENDITDKIWNVSDMETAGNGYLVKGYASRWITFVQYDEQNKVIGLLPLRLYFYPEQPGISIHFGTMCQGSTSVTDTVNSGWEDDIVHYTYTLYKEYKANDSYSFNLYCYYDGDQDNSKITAAYAGMYNSIADAQSKEAVDIKDQLFSSVYNNGGYAADYSNGVIFSIFVGEDGDDQQAFHYQIQTVTGDRSKGSDDGPVLSDNALCRFYGVFDKGAETPNENILIGTSEGNDSYGENNYRTIFVKKDTDLKNLALTFSVYDGAKLYAEGNTTAEESGVTTHDFSHGPIQYTVSAENGKNSKNYWVQVVKEESGQKLYVTSLADEDSKTSTDNNGVVTSTREIMIDNYHDNLHDILVANIGDQDIPELKVELVSDTLELNDYWTLTGNHELKAMSNTKKENEWSIGKLQNMAKVRLARKDGVENGSGVTGTLTFKSGDTTLLVLKLTGTIGDPCITTKEIPEAVKYVPYGSMIQNSNKYSWNSTSYQMISGKLPEGMELKENGELYGVPKEAGEFTFMVRMDNSYRSFSSSVKEFTLKVLENTDYNVSNATDKGYELSETIQNVGDGSAQTYKVVSEGEFGEFQDVYLDGEKLIKDTDYTADSGSTHITIKSQTLTSKGSGSHTIGIEFRTSGGTGEVKKAAQNYTIASPSSPSNPGTITTPSNPGSTTKPSTPSTTKPSTSKPSTTKPSTTKPSTTKPSKPNKETNQPNKTTKPNKTTTSSTKKKKAKKYTVRKGDSFWKIAVKYYGDGTKWKKIYQANKKIVSSPDKLRVGQKITIPAK